MLQGMNQLTVKRRLIESGACHSQIASACRTQATSGSVRRSTPYSDGRGGWPSPPPSVARTAAAPRGADNRSSQHQQRGRDHHQQLVLGHVGGEEHAAESVERRDQGQRERRPARRKGSSLPAPNPTARCRRSATSARTPRR